MNKPITLLTTRQAALITSSVRNMMTSGDINKLTMAAYKFIMLSSGFIAHYNLLGFRDVYRNVADLKEDLLRKQPYNQWFNFRPGDEHYDYYMQKRDLYNAICEDLMEVS
jgi:hypothetical protein